jgi:Xaa-Pro aminopeptidase
MLTAADYEKIARIIETYRSTVDLTVRIPLDEYEKRYERVHEKLREREIDVAFFFWYREYPGDGVYLTGYNPNIERASGIIAPGKRPALIVGPESGLLAAEIGLNLETHFVEEFSIPDEYYEGLPPKSFIPIISEYAGKEIKRVGFLSPLDYVPVKFYDVFQSKIGEGIEIVDASDILSDLRYEKSEAEFACMKQANTIACAAVRAMLAVARPGLRETEVAAVADYVVKALGGDGTGFETIVNSGARARTVIGPASNKVIREGEIVQVGCSPSYEGYKGVARCAFVMGERSEIQKQYFDALNTGYEKAEAELKNVVENNLPSNPVDLAPRNYFATLTIEGYNMKQCHFFSTCHGTGLTECLEPMVIHPERETLFGTNVGIMLDLGLYGHPNDQIAGGCVENAFFKRGRELIKFTDLPTDVQHLVGVGL